MQIKLKRIISQTTKEELKEVPWGEIGQEFLVLALFICPRDGFSVCVQVGPYSWPGFLALDGFEIISQHMPSIWVMSVSENNVISYMPESWSYDNFFDELDDQDKKAVELFNQETEKMYREEGLV